MKAEVKELFQSYLDLHAKTERAFETLKSAAIANYEFHVGDKIEYNGKIGRITSIVVKVAHWSSRPTLDVEWRAYPIKKDGTTAQVGEMRPWYGDKVKLVERVK